MYGLQPRLEQPRGKRALRLLEQPRFRSAFDLLMLRAQFGLAPPEIATWWTRLQEAAPERREALLDTLPKPRVTKAATGAAASVAGQPDSEQGAAEEAMPRPAHRRRRRRRFRGAG
jgi:poly(A) polymerase